MGASRPHDYSPAQVHERVGFFLDACMWYSDEGYVLIRYSATHREWRVNVRIGLGIEHTAASKESLLIALARAVEWLRDKRGPGWAARQARSQVRRAKGMTDEEWETEQLQESGGMVPPPAVFPASQQ